MTWPTSTIPGASLASLPIRIRTAGGTVACPEPGADGVRVTWTTIPSQSDLDAADPTAHQ